MNILDKEQRLKELLETNIKNEKIGTAIAITGPWGVGKTFFWKKFIERDNFKKKYVYVSLFGLQSLSDLKTHIYCNIENNHSTLEIPRWVRGLPSIFKDTRVSHFGLSIPTKIFDSLMFNQVKDAIICFDDFERMSDKLDIKDVMGLANYLKLEKNCQIILILDEDKTEAENKNKYGDYKEKLVDETIILNSVEPLIRENTKGIDEKLINLMIDFAEKLEIHNFRFFQKVIKLFRHFLTELTKDIAYSTKEIILIRILQGYLIQDFPNFEYSWDDCKYVTEKEREAWSPIKKQIYEKLQNISYSFNREDEWLIEFKKWFEQRDIINFNELNRLANSELISDENQNIRNKIWRIFEKRHDLELDEKDLEYIASLEVKYLAIEGFHNSAFMYEILHKYLPTYDKAEQFKAGIISYIHSDLSRSIAHANKERQLWGYESNIFYRYIDDLAKNHVEEKTLSEIASYFLKWGNFKSENDKDQLRKFSFDEWFKYLTEEIYQETFFIEGNDSLIQYLKRLYLITREDDSIDSIIVRVLQKIGQESEFKKRYMQDIIENHLMTKT
ncbi:KAP family P-loop domain protein [Acinetobacter pittii]|uniref:KAP family P-loop domain protein n=4 Tax=Acinetobacter pittii TaxID=48296 RepID=A0A8I1H6W4_ACIPI|nr:P-loop NTPase fold protein [Acinetobacter pittii]MBF9202801.1 KAP family P-loop domain protein [Acinetobacter pittii]MBK1445596.1 KAP family P-loop domain protein [Acinetobacter pittii]MBW8293234.1 KAP family NTPase [Acinetobacter pittii]MCJ9041403.1 KAP family NTPase [Acinetobacter pittii]MDX8220440.1 KAP family P-loop domain protein [Acinetobacter pittii]